MHLLDTLRACGLVFWQVFETTETAKDFSGFELVYGTVGIDTCLQLRKLIQNHLHSSGPLVLAAPCRRRRVWID